jgi:NADPH:quinone reductase-like Zn-dependent oxidoreductase
VFGWIAQRRLKIWIDRVLPLEDAPAAHRALEGRETMGKVLLQP